MDQELADALLELIEECKRLSNHIVQRVPHKYTSNIRGELYLDNYLNGLTENIKLLAEERSNDE